MKNHFLTILCFMNFAGSVVGSEKESKIVSFKVSGFILENNHPLYYRDSKYIGDFNKKCGANFPSNECFVQVSYSPVVSQEQYSQDFIKSIAFIPLKCFYNKKEGSELFSFSTGENKAEKIKLVLDVSIDQKELGNWINLFCNKPQWTQEDDIQELCANNIIEKKNIVLENPFSFSLFRQLDEQFEAFANEPKMGSEDKTNNIYIHGTNGFFKELLKKIKAEESTKKQEELRQKAKLWALRLKILFGFSATAIIMYCLYQQIYATAE